MAEKRLIDVNVLYEMLEEIRMDYSAFKADVIEAALDEYLAQAPTVEAVEVVRCKDCHWWRLINKRNGFGICSHEVFSLDDCPVAPVTEPNDFCSYGERRSNETD